MQENELISTEEFARPLMVKPQTIRRAHCLQGHYFGAVPVKLPNGFLAWHKDDQLRLLQGSKAA